MKYLFDDEDVSSSSDSVVKFELLIFQWSWLSSWICFDKFKHFDNDVAFSLAKKAKKELFAWGIHDITFLRQ